MRIQGIEYANYDQAGVEAFMNRSRVRRLGKQLEVAERRGFSSTKIPLETLRYLLSLIA